MPYYLHRADSAEPTVLVESDVRRIFGRELPDPQMQKNSWRRLNQNERVFIKGGYITFERETS